MKPLNLLLAPSADSSSIRAVASLYASFSKFLGKALRCYAKSKLASVIEAFAFPWEAKFQKVVGQIDAQIRRIQELASASHFHATLCNQSLLQSLWRQQEERAPSRQDSGSEQLRMEIKEEMKREIDDLLQKFNNSTLGSLLNFPHPNLILSLEICLGSFYSSDVSQSSLIFLKERNTDHEIFKAGCKGSTSCFCSRLHYVEGGMLAAHNLLYQCPHPKLI